MNIKEYDGLTLEELLAERKKVKQSQMLSAGTIGFLIGVMIYGVAKGGFGFLYLAIPLFLIAGIAKVSQVQKQNLREIQTAINVKTAAG